MGKSSNLLIAVLAGAAAGIAIGLLLSPDKGTEARKKINETAKKLADGFLEKAEEILDHIAEPKPKA